MKTFSFSVAGFFGGRAARQVPENSLKQFRKPKPQILISFPVAGYFLLRPDSGTQVFLKIPPIFQTPNRTGSFPVTGFFAAAITWQKNQK